MKRQLLECFYRVLASTHLPRRWVPPSPKPFEHDGPLKLEIVSHCWRYSRLLMYQLSSLFLHPPQDVQVTMTVFHCPEDTATGRVMEFFQEQHHPNIFWNWSALPKEKLFRRALGRNLAALQTRADWVWFADCDLLFHQGCIDSLAEALPGSRAVLVFPRSLHSTRVIDLDPGLTEAERVRLADMDIAATALTPISLGKAVGALQIVRGEIARSRGYCNRIKLYQEPVDHWHKTYEDRTFRWLLGTAGEPIEIPSLFRIEHARKGRKRSGRRAMPS